MVVFEPKSRTQPHLFYKSTPLFVNKKSRLQNSLYFCMLKYLQAVKQKVWSKAENGEQDRR